MPRLTRNEVTHSDSVLHTIYDEQLLCGKSLETYRLSYVQISLSVTIVVPASVIYFRI